MVLRAPDMIIPQPPVKSYNLRIDIYNGQELPGNQGQLHFSIGPHLKKSKTVIPKAGIFEWRETIDFGRIILPIDVTQIPDLIVYFAEKDVESHRKCFFRIKPPKILNRAPKKYNSDFRKPSLVKFREDSTLELVEEDQFSGFVIMRPVLFTYQPPPQVEFANLAKSTLSYQLKLFFYVGRNFPTALDGGTCNPVVVIRCGNKALYSSVKKNTLNPEWYEVKSVNIEAPDFRQPDSPSLALVIMVYHVDDPDIDPKYLFDDSSPGNENDLDIVGAAQKVWRATNLPKKVLLGRYWLEMELDKQKIYKDPTTSSE